MRIRQQASAAEISRMILAAGRLDELIEEILRNVAETLSADSCNVLELQADGVTLLLRACHGWSAGEVGQLSVRADVDTPIGLTVRLRQPITFEDLNVDERFLHMHLVLRDHGMVSGVCVIIPGEATGVWGALSVQSRQRQQFSADDVNYLQIVAKILADAITASAGRENLMRSEQLLRRFYDAGLVGMALSAPGKGWLQINDTFCDMVGYTRDDLLGKNWTDILHPEESAEGMRYFNQMLAGEIDGYTRDTRYLHKDGQVVPVTVSTKCARKADGTIDYVVAFVQDVSERRRMEETLRKNEGRLREAQRLARLGFWEWDVRSGETYWSDEMYAITGLDPRSFKLDYDSISSFVPAEDRASYEEFFRKVLDEGSVHGFEHRVLTPNGEIRYHNVHGELMRDAHGAPVRVLGTVMDITERRQAQEALRQARDELEQRVEERTMELYQSAERAKSLSTIAETTLQNMGQGIIMVNADNKILIYNDLLQNYTGVSREQAMRCRSLDEYLLLYKEAAGEEEFLRDAQYSRMRERIAYEMTTPDGKVIEVRQNPLLGGGFVRTYTDISQLKQVQADYLAAKEKAEAANVAKANFLATMSHEIRTPMNGVIGMTDLLLQTRLDDEQREMLQTINDCGQSLLTILNDILDFSKIEAGKLELEAIPMSLTDVVEGSAQIIVHNAIRKELRLLTFVDPALPQFVTGDPLRLRQILINLGGNAIKFTEKGKVVIRADRVAGSENGDVVVRFSVIDEGIGISRAAQRNLFKPFTQAESSTTRRYGGTGLGLSICQRLAEMMDSEIGVHSSVGEGSEFYLTLSFRRCDKVRSHVNVSDLGGLKILLIAADDVELEIYRRYLERWHAGVEACNDLGGCLERCRSAAAQGGPYNVVIVSSQWPVEQQLEMSRVVREDPPLAATKFVLLKRGRRRRPRLENDGCVTLDVDQLRRSAFLSAVSIASGRASPEVDYEAQVEELRKVKAAPAPSVERALAHGRLILVAEDNPTNRDVIRRQLNVLGYACEMVEDGRQALAALRGKRYALLLTDCQMPNMDGFELTSRIRREEEATGRHIGIIAITANALQGEAERCLAAGMDDYLAKPIDMKELRDKLRQWLLPVDTETKGDARPARLDSSRARPHPGGNGGACPINETTLKSLFGDDPQACKEILHDFIDPSQKIIHEIENGWKARSADGIRAAAHKLKSAARSIGADRLADLCVTLETAGREENWEMLDEEVPSLNQLMKDIEKYIARL
jgi:PAS domain S-box-containing protein